MRAAGITVALAGLALAGCGGEDGGGGGGGGEQKLFFTAGEQFKTVPTDSDTPRAAMKQLLAGPTEAQSAGPDGADTQIPDGTELRAVDVEEDGTATVRLSPEFTGGIPADPDARTASERQQLDARLAQVTYTLTQYDGVEDAQVVSGGEVVHRSVDRRDFEAPAAGPKPVRKARGEKLPGTRQVQKRLAKLGYLPKSAVDGLAGYRTQQAVIAFQSWEGLDRDGVVGPVTSAALAQARRPKPRPGGPARRMEVYRDRGVTLLVEGGRTKRAIHTSSGASGTSTPPGRFEVFRKELQSWSVPFQTWLPYASYFNQGIAFHEYPDVPPYPASHGCVRVPAPEAKIVYRFATIGTTVVVY